jgi:hypothetical protein
MGVRLVPTLLMLQMVFWFVARLCVMCCIHNANMLQWFLASVWDIIFMM